MEGIVNTTVSLTGLSSNTSYTYAAYSDSGCSTLLATAASFLTKPGKPTTPSVATNVGSGKLTVTASVTGTGTLSKWQYQQKEGSNNYGSWTDIASSTSISLSHTFSGLNDGTSYQYKVRAVNATGTGAESDASTAAAPAARTLTAGSVEATTATLTIGNHTGNWYYKANAAPHASCSSSAVTGDSVNLTGLSSNTSYTYAAYSDSGCSTLLATAASLLTKPGKPITPSVATNVGSGKLTVTASVTGTGTLSKWQYQQKEGSNNYGSWTDIASTDKSLNHTFSGLTNGTNYQYKVRAVNATGPGAESDASTAAAPAARTLTAGSVEATMATLTIGNHTGNWYYKANAAPHASCSSSAVTGASVNLTGLSSNTSYTYAAYSDSGCSTLLATAASFLTKPGKPTTPSVATNVGSGKLTVTASVTGTGTLSKWQYQQKEGSGQYGSWTDIAGSTSISLSHTFSGLNDGTSYQYKVRAVNATGPGAESDASTAVAPAVQTLVAPSLAASKIKETTATLTISNHTAAWWYKGNQSGAQCIAVAANTTTASLTGLTGGTSYIYKAYSDSSCAMLLATAPSFLTNPGQPTTPSASAQLPDPTLTASTTTHNATTLTISKWSEAWYYQHPVTGTCPEVVAGTSSVVVTGLTAGTSYTFTAYSDSGCTTEIATANSVTTLSDPTLTASTTTHNATTLTISKWSGSWYYQHPVTGTCMEVVAGTSSVAVTGLTAGTTYNFTAYSDSGCTTEIATANSVTTLPAGVTVSPTTLTVAENGGVGAYSLVLESQPLR